MGKKELKQEYLELLTENEHSQNSGTNLIALQEIKDKYYRLEQELSKERITGMPERDYLENLVSLKFSYINLILAIRQEYQLQNKNEDEKLEKENVILIAKEYENTAKNKAKGKALKHKGSEYRKLDALKLATIDEIRKKYKIQLNAINHKLSLEISDDLNGYESTTNTDMQALYFFIAEAYQNLSNPEYKLSYDENMFLNFKPDQSSKFIQGDISEIIYIPQIIEKNQEKVHAIILTNYQKDQIIAIKTGELGFGKYRKDGKSTYIDADSLDEYAIIKKYANPELAAIRKEKTKEPESITEWSEGADGEVFTIYTKLNVKLLTNPLVDPKYIAYHANALFSNTNMLEAIQKNGGYIGQVVYKQNGGVFDYAPQVKIENGEYCVRHDLDKLCLAKQFQQETKNRKIYNKPVHIVYDEKTRKKDRWER